MSNPIKRLWCRCVEGLYNHHRRKIGDRIELTIYLGKKQYLMGRYIVSNSDLDDVLDDLNQSAHRTVRDIEGGHI
jgi:hypothetical protein